MENKKSVAIVPGSFDPITYGHIAIVKAALKRCDTVYFSVMVNNEKSYMFSMEERTRIARAALKDIDGVVVISSGGMLWELAKELSADMIVKGYRNEADIEYENKMAVFNKAHYADAETVLIKADASYKNISSTVVREKIKAGASLEGYLPIAAIDEINKILNEKF